MTIILMLQVHGIVHDTISFVKGIIATEMNSATDNPVKLQNILPLTSVQIIHFLQNSLATRQEWMGSINYCQICTVKLS